MFGAFVYEPGTSSVWVVGWIPIVAVASVPNRRFRATILAIGGGFIALWTPDAVFLWPAVSAFVMVSVTEDLHEVPIVGWAFGFAGSIGGLFLYPGQADGLRVPGGRARRRARARCCGRGSPRRS